MMSPAAARHARLVSLISEGDLMRKVALTYALRRLHHGDVRAARPVLRAIANGGASDASVLDEAAAAVTLARRLAALVGDATGGRPFVAEDHTAMRWVLATDATLYQGGGVFYEVVVDGGTLVLTAFGGTLPSTLHGVNLLLQPIGVGELAAAVIGLETLEASPGLAPRARSR